MEKKKMMSMMQFDVNSNIAKIEKLGVLESI